MSILSIQRQAENADVISKEVMIPLYQKSAAKSKEIVMSSQFKSKVKKIDFMDLSERPGPGDY